MVRDGVVDIGIFLRELKLEEKGFYEYKIVIDGIVVVVYFLNLIDNLLVE